MDQTLFFYYYLIFGVFGFAVASSHKGLGGISYHIAILADISLIKVMFIISPELQYKPATASAMLLLYNNSTNKKLISSEVTFWTR